MSVPTKLPKAHEATVAREKLEDYCLNPDHETGRHKARVFRSTLGIGRPDWAYLRDQLLTGVLDAPVVAIHADVWGTRYEVTVSVDGLNGTTHPVTSVWIILGDEPPRLCSAYVDVP